jgi:hypothetical protein
MPTMNRLMRRAIASSSTLWGSDGIFLDDNGNWSRVTGRAIPLSLPFIPDGQDQTATFETRQRCIPSLPMRRRRYTRMPLKGRILCTCVTEDAMAKPSRQDQTDRWVQTILEAIVRNAELDADRVIGFLNSRGFKCAPRSRRKQVNEALPTGPVANMLLNLAAALRLRAWERAGLKVRLPNDLPSANEAMAVVADCRNHLQDNMEHAIGIPLKVFRTLLAKFASSGPADLRTDVLVDAEMNNEFYDAVAKFLWQHRHVLRDGEGSVEP